MGECDIGSFPERAKSVVAGISVYSVEETQYLTYVYGRLRDYEVTLHGVMTIGDGSTCRCVEDAFEGVDVYLEGGFDDEWEIDAGEVCVWLDEDCASVELTGVSLLKGHKTLSFSGTGTAVCIVDPNDNGR